MTRMASRTEMVERERRQLFDAADESYRRFAADPRAWAEYRAEIEGLQASLLDDLTDEMWVR